MQTIIDQLKKESVERKRSLERIEKNVKDSVDAAEIAVKAYVNFVKDAVQLQGQVGQIHKWVKGYPVALTQLALLGLRATRNWLSKDSQTSQANSKHQAMSSENTR